MSGNGGVKIAAAVTAALVMASGAHGKHHHGLLPSLDAFSASPMGARAAIRYAEHQIGKPYQWGAAGPGSFDCSGLTMEAEQAAGVDIPRTSQQQWANLQHVSRPRPGDLVFFAGADGTVTSPGHVGLVIGRGRMVEAFGTGVPVRIASYRGRGAIGYARPS